MQSVDMSNQKESAETYTYNTMLTALHEAALAIADGLSLPRTLQRIADTARTLVQTRYAALGVLSNDENPTISRFITSGVDTDIAEKMEHAPNGQMGLLSAIFTEGKSIKVDRITDDPRSTGFCEGHPDMTTFLGTPIISKGRPIGNLYLSDRLDGNPFDERDKHLLELLASHATIAIENARLHQELQAAALRSERDRIGMELHDGVIQTIYAVGMKMEILRGRTPMNKEQQGQYQNILEDLNKIIDEIRGYIHNLLTARDEHSTLRQLIDNIVSNFRDFSGIPVTLNVADNLPLLSDLQRHNLLQTIREALANVARHSQASRTSVTLHYIKNDREFFLSVRDNGIGFTEQPHELETSFGLRNMRMRARRIDGTLNINSAAGQGSEITLRFPARAQT